jgi:hypothetical protein
LKLRYLLGTPFSGSTALGTVLTTSGAHYAGELDRLPYLGTNRFPLKKLFCIQCRLRGVECPIYSDAHVAELRHLGVGSRFFEKIAEISGSETIIDGSKHADWLRATYSALSPDDRDDVRAIVCVRSPFAYYRSNRYADPNEPPWRVGENWRNTYLDLLRTLHLFQIPHLVVRNEDFVTMHGRTLEAVGSFFDLPVAPARSYMIENFHTVGGNPILHDKASQAVEFEIRPLQPSTEGLQASAVAEILNVPGLYSLANDIFGYGLNAMLS